MADNNILSAEGSLLERINEYQRKIADLSINLLGKTVVRDDQWEFNYKIINVLLRNWVLDLNTVIKGPEKEEIQKMYLIVADACELDMFSMKILHTIAGEKPDKKPNRANLEIVKTVFYALESKLKEQTTKYFSTKKEGGRLIK